MSVWALPKRRRSQPSGLQKEWPQFGGVLAPTPGKSPPDGETALTAAGGRNLGRGPENFEDAGDNGITNALQLARANPTFIRKNFNVVLERTVRELNGEPCISLEEAPRPNSRLSAVVLFGERVTTYEAMRQAVCQHAERAAEKLRGEHQYCRHISAFIKTSPFAINEPYYGNLATEKLMTPTGHALLLEQDVSGITRH